jgi:hypothetical protein
MKNLMLVALLFAVCAVYGETEVAVEEMIVTVKQLKAEGFIIIRTRLDTPSASDRIDAYIEPQQKQGEYQSIDFVVLKEDVVVEGLCAIDSSITINDRAARLLTDTKPHAVFLVRGKEIAKAYLAIEVLSRSSAGVVRRCRYLLPVTAVYERAGVESQ